MKSDKPKVLCEVLFTPMLDWVVTACEKAGLCNLCVVTGNGAEQVEAFLDGDYATVRQEERRGTGHAVMMAESYLKGYSGKNVLILCGDAPFMDEETIQEALKTHVEQDNAVTVVTACLPDPTGYGRILRDGDAVTGIVEQKDATEEQRAIREVNSGAYWFKVDDLLSVLHKLTCGNAQGEYYLTDTVSLLIGMGKRAGAYCSKDSDVVLGANDRRTLCKLNEIARDKILGLHMDNGVEFVTTDGILIAPGVKIGAGSTILPGTILRGYTEIGQNCVIGPNTLLEDTSVGDETILNAVQAYQSKIHAHVKIGPFTHIRPNSEIKSHVKIGDFVEVKNSVVGEGTAIAHLTYVGDSDVGRNVNFGCGTVTVNYDGVSKFRTVIGDDAFIGCNTNLVAPVKVGNGAYTAAGSTVTKDVPDGALAIARSRQENKEGFAERKLRNRKKRV